MKTLALVTIAALAATAPAHAATSKAEVAKNRAAFVVFLRQESADLAIPTPELLAMFILSTKYDLSLTELFGGLHQTGAVAHDAEFGRDNQAAEAMSQLGIKVKTQDGAPLMGAYVEDLADAIQRQKDPYTKEKICQYLGCTAILPMLRDGGGQIKSMTQDAVSGGLN